jgi:hypothetical protein
MYGKLPSYGIYCRHVKGLRMRSIDLDASATEARPAMVCDDVQTLDIDGLRAAAVESGKAVVKLAQTRGALLRGCCAPAGTKVFLEVRGERTAHVILTGSDVGAAAKPVLVGPEVPHGAVFMDAQKTELGGPS